MSPASSSRMYVMFCCTAPNTLPVSRMNAQSQADRREQVPCRLIELTDVPHDVHVPHVIAGMPWEDRAAIGEEAHDAWAGRRAAGPPARPQQQPGTIATLSRFHAEPVEERRR